MKWTKTKIEKKHIFGFNSVMITDDHGTVAVTKRFHAELISACPEMLELLEEVDAAIWEGELKPTVKAMKIKSRVSEMVNRMVMNANRRSWNHGRN